MFDKKYYPGDTCSFHFTSARLRTIDNVSVIIFETEHIKHVKGTIENKAGELPFYEGYKGKVFMRENLIWDWGFHDIRDKIKRTKKSNKIKLPQHGFYSEYGRTTLHLDIDDKGKVWLTEKTFYEESLYRRLSDLKQKFKETQNQIKELQEEINEFHQSEAYDAMDEQRKNEEFDAYFNYYSSMQDELSRDEINRMNEESDGFWNVD